MLKKLLIRKFIFIFIVCILLSCIYNKNEKTGNSSQNANYYDNNIIIIDKPTNGLRHTKGEPLECSFHKYDNNTDIDSILIFINNCFIKKLNGNENKIILSTVEQKLGNLKITFEAYSGSEKDKKEVRISLLSNINPLERKYKIINVFPHSTNSYTQGLIYKDGVLYESAGLYGKSAIRIVNIKTGESIKSSSLSNNYFAEGIALYNNKIYQITWKERTCFVYDQETLNSINQYYYNIEEGWGLAFDGKNILMSDGSNIIYIIEPNSFTVTDQFEVMDNKGLVNNLNELEYVDGKLYANVYQENYIVVIDCKTGSVIEKIDFSGLLKDTDKSPSTDVLNGIAYNPEKKSFYITGKNWPKLFEIVFLQ